MLVISDEIFAGLWRLGSASAWERLHIMPDIACYAKLLTGVAPPSYLQQCLCLSGSIRSPGVVCQQINVLWSVLLAPTASCGCHGAGNTYQDQDLLADYTLNTSDCH